MPMNVGHFCSDTVIGSVGFFDLVLLWLLYGTNLHDLFLIQ